MKKEIVEVSCGLLVKTRLSMFSSGCLFSCSPCKDCKRQICHVRSRVAASLSSSVFLLSLRDRLSKRRVGRVAGARRVVRRRKLPKMYFQKRKQQRLSSLAYLLMRPFPIHFCLKFFLILPASVSYMISFVSSFEPLLFPLLPLSSLCRGERLSSLSTCEHHMQQR